MGEDLACGKNGAEVGFDLFEEIVAFANGPFIGNQDVDGDELAGAGGSGAEGVEMDLVAFVAFENGFEGLKGFGREGAVEESVDGSPNELKAHANDEESDCEGDEGVQPGPAGDPDEEHAEEDASGCPDVGHEMMAVSFEGGAVGGTAFGDEEATDDEVEDGSQGGNGQACAELMDLGRVGDAADGGPEDGAGSTQDEGSLEATGEELDFVVAESMFVIRWQGGNEQGTESGGGGG